MSTYDAPNQQVVRADGSAPWEEGNGGSKPPVSGRPKPAKAEKQNDTAEATVEAG